MKSFYFSLVILFSIVANSQSKFTPEWSKGIIWYQIFPERFNNGDPTNDPKVTDQNGAYPFDDTSAFQIHPWTSDWYQLQPYEQQNGKDLYYNLQRRRYGGDLQGIINKLDYIKSLGVNAIYLTPIFWSPSSHKYDALCYHHVDPTFGPDPEGDVAMMKNENPLDVKSWVWTKADLLALKLIKEVHARNMRIIFDGVFNHMGMKSFAFEDVQKNQQASAYSDWFSIDSWDDPAKGTTFQYKGWFGVKTLPEFKEDEKGIVAGPKAYIFNATKRWMNPMDKGIQDGIDGWRLDVAYDVGHPFWKDWRRWVRSINPTAYMTAELVSPIEKTRPYLEGDEFDATMNYNFAFIVHDFFIQDKLASTVTQFDAQLATLREAFGNDVALNMQNLMNSHDATRLASAVANPDGKKFGDWGAYFNWSQKSNNKEYNARKPTAAQVQKQKLIAAFQMLYLGSPMIFYGDEAGIWGGNDPDCRKPMVWDDKTYDAETYNPDQSTHEPDAVAFNKDLYNWYQKFMVLRNNYKSIQLGNYTTIAKDDAQKLYVFSRKYQGEEVLVCINRSDKPVNFTNELLKTNKFKEVFSNKVMKTVTIEPMNLVVLSRR
ncbi:alpha-glucosidase C-terminal domain-containing protein [Flavobacterium sp. J49]|uniref:glycoside hydrolase family 13 protein n=1 Tax=Flavobacterium sp. J49 TaxID=2718534 RepID=UPI001592E210|nr:glycoside hydrolase family 13 protein [Flavobacterium sp. J49]MBF6641979.1 alpha-glucosidase C-terminal domain-containing protein [Flavobacterium sp. J49]NIC03227.1 alpha-amylase [Flavobacterium sp. J49]